MMRWAYLHGSRLKFFHGRDISMMIVGRIPMMVEREIHRGGESESTLWKTEEERGEEAWAAMPAELKVRTAALQEEEIEEEEEEEEVK